ncbi:MAG: hybrid sensor histidine kinase/response regulator [Potamolinea sp.]
MAINSDIRDLAYQFFVEEAPELLQVIETGLLTLKQDKNIAAVHNLMRAAHSIKGGSASVELEAISSLAHRLENIFKALYSETLEIDSDLESQLLQAYDCLRLPLMKQITSGYLDVEQALAIAEPIFTQIEEQLGDALTAADTYIPSSSDLGIDMAKSIFEIDVQQGLDHLAVVVANPTQYQLAGELRAQAEVFVGFAELLNQPGFGEIAQTSLKALDAHPDSALEITQLALSDFQSARLAIIAGDKTKGISPSAELVAYANSNGRHEGLGRGARPCAPTGDWENLQGDSNPHEILNFNSSNSQDSPTYCVEEGEQEEGETEDFFPSLEDIFGGEIAALETDIYEPEEVIEVQVVEFSEAPENLEIALQSIEQIFESLAPIAEIPKLTAESNSSLTTTTNPETHSKDSASPTQNLSVRVDSERLERMSNLVGELAINRNSLSLQNDQLQGSVRELLNRFANVQKMVGNLQQLSNQMLIVETRPGTLGMKSRTSPSSVFSERRNQWSVESSFLTNQETTNNSHFDSLELDSYGVLHSRLQALLEDMMQLEEAVDDIVLFARASDTTLEQQRVMLTRLRDELMWARMLPLGEVINRFPRMLRELSNTHHKPVNLKLSGTSVLVDKAVLEKLYDPLLHLIRNAFDHGIELPKVRQNQGKTEQGQIEIRAYHQGSQTIIEVKDDGAGLNLERIRTRAQQLGLVSVEQLATIPHHRLFELIFEPGFSTAPFVSELSGRGVGLDVVRSQMRSLKGTISVTSTPGVGTTFTLRLPLTLTIAKLLVCFVGSTALSMPSDSIEEIIVPKAQQIKESGTQRFLQWRGGIVPVYRLADCLHYRCPLPDTSPSKALLAVPSPKNWALPLLILRQEQQVVALEIERLVTEQELVIKPFGSAIAPPSYTYGCTILGDGSLIPVIDAALLLENLLGQNTTANSTITQLDLPEHSSVSNPTVRIPTVKVPTVLVVDDAVALRRTLALTLERAGYRVLQAPDGREALTVLQQSAMLDLVICDIEMPNMNGFEFLSARRAEPQFQQVPVVMLTSRSNDKHRWLAKQLGANGYFTKPYLEQEFLGAIKQIIEQSYSENILTIAANSNVF